MSALPRSTDIIGREHGTSDKCQHQKSQVHRRAAPAMTGFLTYRKNNKAIITAAGSNTPTTQAKILTHLCSWSAVTAPVAWALDLIEEFYGHGCEIPPQRRARLWVRRTDR